MANHRLLGAKLFVCPLRSIRLTGMLDESGARACVLRPGLPFDQLYKRPDYIQLALDQEYLLTAARARFREPNEKYPWWIMDVYVTTSGPSTATQTPLASTAVDTDQSHPRSLGQDLLRMLRKISTELQFPCDHRIYRSISFYQGATGGRRNQIAENFWEGLGPRPYSPRPILSSTQIPRHIHEGYLGAAVVRHSGR